MSGPPATPNHLGREPSAPFMTPGSIATQFSKMDLPAPSNLKLNLPPNAAKSPELGSEGSAQSKANARQDTGDISGPEPEAIVQARHKARSESMSEQLSSELSRMKFPQPERIFGPDEGESEAAREQSGRKQGVSADDWDAVVLDDEVPEAVKEPVRMTHSRNTSRVWVYLHLSLSVHQE